MKVVLASKSEGKLREFVRVLSPLGFEVIPQEEACPGLDVEENGATFAENAYLKAAAVYERTGLACIADDSGLCVDALGGAPGVYTARYGGELPYREKMQKLVDELGDLPQEKRTARFVAHICYINSDGLRLDVEETCEGAIGHLPRGERGFGFDPIFMVGDHSFSELEDEEKDKISHRGKALRRLAELLAGTAATNERDR